MEIKERTAKSGKNAGKTYFFVEANGAVVASYDIEAIKAFENNPASVDLKELNGWYWARRLDVPRETTPDSAKKEEPSLLEVRERVNQAINILLEVRANL